MGGVRLGGVPARAQPGWSRACRAVVELPAGGEQRGEVVEPARICSARSTPARCSPGRALGRPAKAPRAQPLHGHPGLTEARPGSGDDGTTGSSRLSLAEAGSWQLEPAQRLEPVSYTHLT